MMRSTPCQALRGGSRGVEVLVQHRVALPLEPHTPPLFSCT